MERLETTENLGNNLSLLFVKARKPYLMLKSLALQVRFECLKVAGEPRLNNPLTEIANDSRCPGRNGYGADY